jgi:hypothetical protein
MSDNTESKEVKESEEQTPIPKERERSCCYVVDPCGCYVDPCCSSPSVVYCC